ncbi:MAG: DUF4179 domain-containing protein [Oscillospiraceae bacterium]|nr:DUF4179 domain-containing protein [Oscillospiraceae bacterium]
MKNQRWDDIFPEVSDTFHERVINTLASQNATQQKNIKKGNFKIMKAKTVIAAAAIIAIIGTLSVGAYTIINNRSPKLAEIFEADEQMQEKLADDGMLQEVNLSATDNGVTMDVLQTLADENMVYIMLKFSSENPQLLDCENFDNLWEHIKIEGYYNYEELLKFGYDKRVDLLPDNVFMSSVSSNIVHDSYETITDENGNTIYQFYHAIIIHNDSRQDYNGREITLSFEDLGACMSKAADFETLIAGRWVASWVLEYQDHTKTFDKGYHVDVNDVDVFVKSVEISPLSINIEIDGESSKTLHKNFTESDTIVIMPEGESIALGKSMTLGEFVESEGFEGFDIILSYMHFIPILDNGEVFTYEDISSMGTTQMFGDVDFISKRILKTILPVERVVGIRAECPLFPEYSFEFSLAD